MPDLTYFNIDSLNSKEKNLYRVDKELDSTFNLASKNNKDRFYYSYIKGFCNVILYEEEKYSGSKSIVLYQISINDGTIDLNSELTLAKKESYPGANLEVNSIVVNGEIHIFKIIKSILDFEDSDNYSEAIDSIKTKYSLGNKIILVSKDSIRSYLSLGDMVK
ncbi:hypothetical protein [Flagellimonas pacifica]|uniref:hypothetical protein n=1 Tax=Flagellimonas pacifica TaxID=1247520 RepID=UPI0010545BB5|nr:hypothetical protein [Allomuricauda parva]